MNIDIFESDPESLNPYLPKCFQAAHVDALRSLFVVFAVFQTRVVHLSGSAQLSGSFLNFPVGAQLSGIFVETGCSSLAP